MHKCNEMIEPILKYSEFRTRIFKYFNVMSPFQERKKDELTLSKELQLKKR